MGGDARAIKNSFRAGASFIISRLDQTRNEIVVVTDMG